MALVLLLASSLVMSVGTAQPLDFEPERPRGTTYLLEGLGGVGGLAGGVAVGAALVAGVYCLTYEPEKDTGWIMSGEVLPAILAGGVFALSLPAWSALGVRIAGDRLGASGPQSQAIAGAYAGVPVAVGLGLIANGLTDDRWGWVRWVSAAAAVAVPAGAFVGYNFGSWTGDGLARSSDRFGLPVVALGCVRDSDGTPHPSVDARLLSWRF